MWTNAIRKLISTDDGSTASKMGLNAALNESDIRSMKHDPLSIQAKIARRKIEKQIMEDDKLFRAFQQQLRRSCARTHQGVAEIMPEMYTNLGEVILKNNNALLPDCTTEQKIPSRLGAPALPQRSTNASNKRRFSRQSLARFREYQETTHKQGGGRGYQRNKSELVQNAKTRASTTDTIFWAANQVASLFVEDAQIAANKNSKSERHSMPNLGQNLAPIAMREKAEEWQCQSTVDSDDEPSSFPLTQGTSTGRIVGGVYTSVKKHLVGQGDGQAAEVFSKIRSSISKTSPFESYYTESSSVAEGSSAVVEETENWQVGDDALLEDFPMARKNSSFMDEAHIMAPLSEETSLSPEAAQHMRKLELMGLRQNTNVRTQKDGRRRSSTSSTKSRRSARAA